MAKSGVRISQLFIHIGYKGNVMDHIEMRDKLQPGINTNTVMTKVPKKFLWCGVGGVEWANQFLCHSQLELR